MALSNIIDNHFKKIQAALPADWGFKKQDPFDQDSLPMARAALETITPDDEDFSSDSDGYHSSGHISYVVEIYGRDFAQLLAAGNQLREALRSDVLPPAVETGMGDDEKGAIHVLAYTLVFIEVDV